ncbi:MAG: asparagine synthase (glutamine-hydrolyzing), partial [Bdellovibrionales bacterium]|nr:asparagine synthase (glutamine-hydrolyzing) [Bdellovibrionales bacterium]
GEIYNFRKMRKELEGQSVSLKGNSDTEVFLNYIECFGLDKALEKACGMFAFALLDKKEQKLYLGRDRAGEKPLYYFINGHQLVFSSEMKSLKASSLWSDRIDSDHLALFMRHNYVPTPFSIYEKTFKLPTGSILEVSLDPSSRGISLYPDFSPFPKKESSKNQLAPRSYWSLAEVINKREISKNSFEENVDQLEKILEEVVSEQMISDVTLGAFLSGGIDSSLVVALMQKIASSPVKTFSLGFTEDQFNEAHHAKAVADHLGTDHTQLYVTLDEARQVIPDLPTLYDEPFADSSQIPTYLVARLARKDVTVSLSGDGGDELFGGYNRYFLAQKIWNQVGGLPRWAKNIGSTSIESLSPQSWDRTYGVARSVLPKKLHFKLVGDKLYKVSEVLKAESSLEMYHNLTSHWKNTKELVPSDKGQWSILKWLDDETSLKDFREVMMFLDFSAYLPDDILAKVDRAAMAVSLETRIPLLDKRVIEFAWGLPMDHKIQGSQGKRILRELLYRHVPKSLIERPKMGFSIPIGDWIKGPMREWADDLLSEGQLNKSGFLNAEPIQQRWKDHLNGDKNWQASLWNVLVFQQWYEATQ